jgi:ABC-type nickel/cobalt efflux system permease component RcnA
MGRHRRSIARRLAVAPLAIGLGLLLPAIAAAHPLGNFTINHYAGIRVEVDHILLDVVIDRAEIPTFQARQDFDLDADGSVSDDEIEAGRVATCHELARSLDLSLGGIRQDLQLREAGLSFPLGAGGLSTMREVCLFEAPLSKPIGVTPAAISFTDTSFAERLGWREIVVQGSDVTLRGGAAGTPRPESVSDRLRTYPPDMVARPLADRSIAVEAVAGGTPLPVLQVPDAQPVPGAVMAAPTPGILPPAPHVSPLPIASAVPAAVPGGVTSGELPGIFRTADLSPLIVLVALATAAGLGAGHALTPGHGKTLMAAYLVGSRGSARHALALGVSVSASHTVGILVLAAVIVAATDVVAPDVVVRWAPVVAAISIVMIGGWMLVGEVRRRRGASYVHGAPGHDHARPLDHAHLHDHAHPHDHRHHAAPGATFTWRGLFLLGLAGGLIPSTSALLILLGSIAAGRPAFGFVLVVAFGLGMAAVMAGVGLALVAARDRFDRVQAVGGLGRLSEAVPLVASVIVLGFGVFLTAQALTAIPAL